MRRAGWSCGKLDNMLSLPILQAVSLAFFALRAAGAPQVATSSSGSSLVTRAACSLDTKLKAQGKKYWGTFDASTLSNPTTGVTLLEQFGQITLANSLMWGSVEPARGSFNFGSADAQVNWAVSNGKLVRGHALGQQSQVIRSRKNVVTCHILFIVWHSQLPAWVSSISDKTTLISVIQNHISTVAGRYRGKIYVECS
ncbi:glycoside hydrolase superfamily [Panaeolus papilionaceus]|nr:glycoside hydrolase superfamily [Panaeolus papilionaceus]